MNGGDFLSGNTVQVQVDPGRRADRRPARWELPGRHRYSAERRHAVGALMSIVGLGLVLWSLIEAPVRGWSSPLVIGAGIGGLAVLAIFVGWVAVIGSLLNTRYQDKMISALASHHIPHAILQTILGSIGGALAVADRVGGFLGAELGQLARSAFISGMDLGLATGAGVAAAGCVIALLALPSRVRHHQEGRPDGRSPGGPGH